jgi:hypothetical protein
VNLNTMISLFFFLSFGLSSMLCESFHVNTCPAYEELEVSYKKINEITSNKRILEIIEQEPISSYA